MVYISAHLTPARVRVLLVKRNVEPFYFKELPEGSSTELLKYGFV